MRLNPNSKIGVMYCIIVPDFIIIIEKKNLNENKSLLIVWPLCDCFLEDSRIIGHMCCSHPWDGTWTQNIFMIVLTTEPAYSVSKFSFVYLSCFNILSPCPLFSSVRWYRKQAKHSVGPGAAVSNPEEVLWKLWSRNGQPWDHKHRPQSESYLS